MNAETRIESICTMLHEFDEHTGNRGAEGVISHPEKWIDSAYYPFYAAAAEMLIEARASIDTRTGSAGTLAAVKRIVKNCQNGVMKGVFEQGGRFCVCDGYRLIRSNADFSSVPHINTDFNTGAVIDDLKKNPHPVNLPTVAELKTWLASFKAKNGASYGTKKAPRTPYVLTFGNGQEICVNPVYLLDMLQALPGCTATAKNPLSGLYFTAENGDGLLLPVRLKEKKAEEKEAA